MSLKKGEYGAWVTGCQYDRGVQVKIIGMKVSKHNDIEFADMCILDILYGFLRKRVGTCQYQKSFIFKDFGL